MNNDYTYTLQVDTSNELQLSIESDSNLLMDLSESINVIKREGAKIYYDTTDNWDLVPDLVGERGSIYVYSDRFKHKDDVGNVTLIPGLKVGDGNAYLIDLPFTDANSIRALAEHIRDNTRHITQEERTFWNNKVSSYVNQDDSENLVLSKTNYVLED